MYTWNSTAEGSQVPQLQCMSLPVASGLGNLTGPEFQVLSKVHSLLCQVLLYPFTSLLAEFGGSLGLFCGFSFLTIWDGLKEVPAWMKRNIKSF